MPEAMLFPHPEPVRQRPRILPVFLPFAGCPHRCLFCDQKAQTGQAVRSLDAILDELARTLDGLERTGAPPREIAFYGGTFTALPQPQRFLKLAGEYRRKGLITRVRCSTRPDAVSSESLAEFKALGLDMVELGVQSFDDRVLAESGRGYTGSVAQGSCELVRESGLALGVQLLPGLPGHRNGVLQADCELVASIRPDAARLYPCLVMEGTVLAEQWRSGDFQPWSLDRSIAELARGVATLWQAGVQVIRMGLAREPGMKVLAGPEHPALGQMVRSLILFRHVRDKAETMNPAPVTLRYPAKYSGEIMGHKGELAERYAALGLTDISGWERDEFALS